MNVLALNAGSTSLKFRFGGTDSNPLYKGSAQGFGGAQAKLEITDAAGTVVDGSRPGTLQEAAQTVLRFIRSGGAPVNAIGHRFVHGGPDLLAHRLIGPVVRSQLNAASAFAPLHNPPALTHEFISLMLGVRRPGVTNAIAILESRKVIQANRGSIVILNRDALLEAANGSYGPPEAEFERYLGGLKTGPNGSSASRTNP